MPRWAADEAANRPFWISVNLRSDTKAAHPVQAELGCEYQFRAGAGTRHMAWRLLLLGRSNGDKAMRPSIKIALIAAVSGGVVLSCDKQPEPPKASPSAASPASVEPQAAASASAPTTERSTPTVPTLMKRHFVKSTEMEAALVRGKLDEFKKASVWLAEHEISADLPVDWKQHVEGMTKSAHAARDAADLEQAGLAFGSMGRACATCHEQLGSPKITVGEPPAEGSGAQPHMLRHQWAAARMWEGLMAPNEDAWVKGAEVLADAALGEKAIAGTKSVPKEIATLAKQTHDLGHQGRTAKTEERGKIYGAFLVTCATCHDKLGVKMK